MVSPMKWHRQTGSFFMEMLVVVAIVAILMALATPNLRSNMLSNDLDSAQDTLLQGLRKARFLARSQGTPVTVRVDAGGRSIQLRSRDGRVAETITLPRRVSISDGFEMVFNPVGTVDGSGVIALTAGDEDGPDQRQVSITGLGAMASLED